MSMSTSYTVESVLHCSIPVSHRLLNKAFKMLRYLSVYYLKFKIYETGSNLKRGVLLMIN